MSLSRRLLIGVFALFLALPLIAQDKDKKKDDKPKDETKKADDKPKDEAKPKDEPKPKPAETPTTGGDKVTLAWKFEKDKPFYQEMTTTTTQNMKVMGQDVKQNQSQTFYFSWTPKELDKDGNWTLVQKIDGIKMSITINEQTISFDSTNPATPNNALGEFFRQLIGSEFKLTMDKAMKVSKVEGRDEFIKKLGTSSANMEPLLKKILSDEALKQMADPTFGIVPGKEVAKGEKWTKKYVLDLGPIGSYTSTFDFSYDGKDGELQKLKVDTKLEYQTPKESGEGLPFRIKTANLTSSKDAGGTMHFNSTKGRLEKSSLKLNLEGSLDIEIGGTTTKVDLKQEQTTVTSTTDTSPIKK